MPVKTAEMFADASSLEERGDRLEALKKALSDSVKRHDSGQDAFVAASERGNEDGPVGILKGLGTGPGSATKRMDAVAERFGNLTKSLTTEEQNAVRDELESLKDMIPGLGKDITVASPGNLHPYDLEAPAKQLVPRFTPLRNELPRQRGQGTAREYRRILGYSNSGMGGVANLVPFFNSESDSGTPTFGSLALRRGQKISYAMDVHTANYMEMSLSDMVTWKAYFTDLGFENVRELSQMALLWAHLLGEERAMLYGRGASGSGYEGAVAAPTYSTPTNAGSGSSLGTGVYKIKLTSYTGTGESLPGSEVTSASITAGNTLSVPVTVQPTGAIAYGVYMTAAGGSTNTETFQGFFIPTSGNIVINAYVAGGAVVPAADGSFNANGYDGFLSVLTDPTQAGYAARFDVTYPGMNIAGNTTAANNVGDKPWQDAFASLYASVYADPEEAWLAAPQRRQITDFLRTANTTAAAYRLTIDNSGATDMQIGGMVTGIVNESSPTARIVDLRVHPYMPAGASFIRQRVLPIPDSGIGDTTTVTAVQDYMSVDWPQIQFTYDASTYWYGTLVHYAPKWSASILGLQ